MGENFSCYDRSSRLSGPLPQPFASGDQALCIILLFSSTGAAVHDAKSQQRHVPVEPSQFGQQLAIFPNHRTSP